jgi:hypothetical protein
MVVLWFEYEGGGRNREETGSPSMLRLTRIGVVLVNMSVTFDILM